MILYFLNIVHDYAYMCNIITIMRLNIVIEEKIEDLYLYFRGRIFQIKWNS